MWHFLSFLLDTQNAGILNLFLVNKQEWIKEISKISNELKK